MAPDATWYNLNGIWYNELNSTLTVTASSDGGLKASYVSAVGRAMGPYIALGRYDTVSQPPSLALVFCLAWQNERVNAHSATSWSGQYQVGPDGEEAIVTTWLLCSRTEIADDWMSTRVGQDVFLRKERSQAEVDARLGRGNFSHPTVPGS